MKNLYKYLFAALIASSTLFYSCETFELEQVNNPNALSPDLADPIFLLNRVQTDYRSAITTFNDQGADLGRIDNFNRLNAGNYLNALVDATLNNPWNRLYSGMIPDIKAIEDLNTVENNLNFHVGISKIMQAHVMMLMVDFLGDIPFSEVNQPIEFPSPKLDDDQAVYNSALALIDDAIAILNSGGTNIAFEDLYYDGDSAKWLKLANTIKMRADLTIGNYTNVVNATGVITDTADDFAFAYGTNVQNPDTRHPDYILDYTTSGTAIYQSNWLMNLMIGPNATTPSDINDNADPRRRYYFYRQNANTPNNRSFVQSLTGTFSLENTAGIAETLQCSLEQTPAHLTFTEQENYWCSTRYGYWGRDHGNSRGTPPDNFLRTAVGVYPSGGLFDGFNDYSTTELDDDGNPEIIGYNNRLNLGAGAGGFGIEPIYLASYIDFMKAEAALASGSGNPSILIRNGLEKSIAKVQSFAGNDPSANLANAPTGAQITTWIDARIAEFDAAPMTSALDANGYPMVKDKMDILSELYFTTIYGGAADAFNFIRRTGYPRTMSRNIDPNPGTFPRTFLYPNVEVSTNPNVNQRPDLNTRVFWDNGLTSPAN